MHDFKETLEWYEENQTTSQIGFNPDGMCLKVCRTARDIDSLHPSAKVAQDATPAAHRVYDVRDLRRGMVLYYDTIGDSNPYGHIVTMVGRVKGFDWDDLHDVLVETNSVKSGELVIVRGDYFVEHWGDAFQFGATFLNGRVLDVPSRRTRVQNFRRSGPVFDVQILRRAIRLEGRVDLTVAVETIDSLVAGLSDDKRRKRLAAFKQSYKKSGDLRMPILDAYVKEHEDDFHSRNIRNALRQVIKSLPEK